MTQEKMRKVIAACVSAATVLFVLLLSYLIYQWVTLAVLDRREKELIKENERLEETIQKGEDDAEFYESILGKEWLAYRYGWEAEDEE